MESLMGKIVRVRTNLSAADKRDDPRVSDEMEALLGRIGIVHNIEVDSETVQIFFDADEDGASDWIWKCDWLIVVPEDSLDVKFEKTLRADFQEFVDAEQRRRGSDIESTKRALKRLKASIKDVERKLTGLENAM